MNYFRSIITICSVILGSVIGAGFASGQEIKIFFSNYGIAGLIGLICSVFLISLVLNCTMRIIFIHNIRTYSDFSTNLFKGIPILFHSMQYLINFFLLASFFIMCIGFSTSLEQQLSLPRFLGSFVISILCYTTFIGNINRITKINSVIIPFLVCLILFAGFKVFFSGNFFISNNSDFNFIFTSFIYASFNTIPLIPLLLTMHKEIDSYRKINIITLASFIFMLVSALSVFIVTCSNISGNSEIILLEVSHSWGNFESLIFSFVVLAAIYTSAICSGYGFAKNLAKSEKQYRVIILIICIIAIFLSNFSFANAVQVVYPFFGILGLLQILFLFIYKNY